VETPVALAKPQYPVALGRQPDFVVGKAEDPYLLRWWVIPRNKLFNVYLHKFCQSDDDRALHDHPWLFNASILLKGAYLEHKGNREVRLRKAGRIYFRWGKAPHRVELIDGQPVWTLFITGSVVREWGFYCKQGWRHWKEFVAERVGGNDRGRGCE
jgi:hypothetical protein